MRRRTLAHPVAVVLALGLALWTQACVADEPSPGPPVSHPTGNSDDAVLGSESLRSPGLIRRADLPGHEPARLPASLMGVGVLIALVSALFVYWCVRTAESCRRNLRLSHCLAPRGPPFRLI